MTQRHGLNATVAPRTRGDVPTPFSGEPRSPIAIDLAKLMSLVLMQKTNTRTNKTEVKAIDLHITELNYHDQTANAE